MLVISQICRVSSLPRFYSSSPTHLFLTPPVFFSCLFQRRWNLPILEIHLIHIRTRCSHSALSCSSVPQQIPRNPLRQILHGSSASPRWSRPPTQMKSATRADAGAFMQIQPTSETRARGLREPGKWLTSHLRTTEREAGGLI